MKESPQVDLNAFAISASGNVVPVGTPGSTIASAMMVGPSGWIDVKEQPPEARQRVIFIARRGRARGIKIGIYMETRIGYGEYITDNDFLQGTHWLPLSILPSLPAHARP